MPDIDVVTTKPDPEERDLQLRAIRTLARHNALDLAPMLFAPLNPPSNPDSWQRKKKRMRGDAA